jgi:uncharacterized protein YjbI with pentapeptide repeats/phage tail protein X
MDFGDDSSFSAAAARTYIAGGGETATSLAQKYNATSKVNDIVTANPGLDWTQPLNQGDQVNIPNTWGSLYGGKSAGGPGDGIDADAAVLWGIDLVLGAGAVGLLALVGVAAMRNRGFLGAASEAEPAPASRMRAVQLLQEINRLKNERLKLPVPPAVRNWSTMAGPAPDLDRYDELSRQIGHLSDEFGDLFGSRGAEWLTPSYPLVPMNIAKLLVMGNTPLQIATMSDDNQKLSDPPELTKAEAHAWLEYGTMRPVIRWWLYRYLPELFRGGPGEPRYVIRSWRVAKWLKHVKDRGGWGALVKERQVHGPGGQTATYRFIDKIDEIQDEDLVRGPRTSVDAVFEHASERLGAAWQEKALRDHRILRERLPEGWDLPPAIRHLNTPALLAEEGRDLEHCVGGYASAVEDGQSIILGVAAPGCRSTAELTPTGKVLQHTGPRNREPVEPCKTIFDEFAASLSPLARLKGYKPIGAQLKGANLQGMDLSEAKFVRADLTDADLSATDAIDADFTYATLSRAVAEAARMTGAKFIDADLQGADFHGANLTRAKFTRASMPGADLHGTYMTGASLEDVSAPGADFHDAHMVDVDITGANLSGADLHGVNLVRAISGQDGSINLQGANLRGADLDHARLAGADLRGADLENARLAGASLRETDFRGANLKRAYLRGVFVKDARFEGASVDDAIFTDAVDLNEEELKKASGWRYVAIGGTRLGDQEATEGLMLDE